MNKIIFLLSFLFSIHSFSMEIPLKMKLKNIGIKITELEEKEDNKSDDVEQLKKHAKEMLILSENIARPKDYRRWLETAHMFLATVYIDSDNNEHFEEIFILFKPIFEKIICIEELKYELLEYLDVYLQEYHKYKNLEKLVIAFKDINFKELNENDKKRKREENN